MAFLNKLISSGVKLSGCSLFVAEQLKTAPDCASGTSIRATRRMIYAVSGILHRSQPNNGLPSSISAEFQNTTHLVVGQGNKRSVYGNEGQIGAGRKTVFMDIKTWQVPYGKLCLTYLA